MLVRVATVASVRLRTRDGFPDGANDVGCNLLVERKDERIFIRAQDVGWSAEPDR